MFVFGSTILKGEMLRLILSARMDSGVGSLHDASGTNPKRGSLAGGLCPSNIGMSLFPVMLPCLTLHQRGENPVGEWTIKVKDRNDPAHKGEFLGWSLALWGSAIDPQKVTKFIEPVEDYSLPQVDDPDRPVIDDPDLTATTQLAKPTDYLPSDHGHAPGDNTTPAFSDQESSDWISHMASVFRTQKWFFAALGA